VGEGVGWGLGAAGPHPGGPPLRGGRGGASRDCTLEDYECYQPFTCKVAHEFLERPHASTASAPAGSRKGVQPTAPTRSYDICMVPFTSVKYMQCIESAMAGWLQRMPNVGEFEILGPRSPTILAELRDSAAAAVAQLQS
jgi:hypothetical protein